MNMAGGEYFTKPPVTHHSHRLPGCRTISLKEDAGSSGNFKLT